MFARIRARWKLILNWIKTFPERRPYTISSIIEEENKIDQIEIEQAERVIVNHQFLIHMAAARMAAREEWRHMQAQRNNGVANNIRPLPVLENARSKRHA